MGRLLCTYKRRKLETRGKRAIDIYMDRQKDKTQNEDSTIDRHAKDGQIDTADKPDD